MINLDGWTERAAALRDELVAAGKLTSPQWQAAVLAVPRHEFVPQFYERGAEPVGPGAWELVSASSPQTRARWWQAVWANTSLVTQLGEVGRWRAQTAAMAGLPQHAPYDRIIAACAVSWVPWAWAEQTRHGGLILVDVKVGAAVGNLVLLRREADRLQGRFDSGYATFMHLRTPAFHVEPQAGPARHRAGARRTTTVLSQERLWDNPPLWFLLHLWQRGRIGFGYAMDPDTGGPGPVFFSTPDGSWCELSPAGPDGTRQVWEGGPRRLWASLQAGIQLWRQHGEPGWDRFGLTVTPHHQTVWLDTPDSDHRWRISSGVTDDVTMRENTRCTDASRGPRGGLRAT